MEELTSCFNHFDFRRYPICNFIIFKLAARFKLDQTWVWREVLAAIKFLLKRLIMDGIISSIFDLHHHCLHVAIGNPCVFCTVTLRSLNRTICRHAMRKSYHLPSRHDKILPSAITPWENPTICSHAMRKSYHLPSRHVTHTLKSYHLLWEDPKVCRHAMWGFYLYHYVMEESYHLPSSH